MNRVGIKTTSSDCGKGRRNGEKGAAVKDGQKWGGDDEMRMSYSSRCWSRMWAITANGEWILDGSNFVSCIFASE